MSSPIGFLFPSFQPNQLQQPVVLGKFCFIREVGKGQFSTVYEAQDINSKEIVAVKMVQKNLLDPESCLKLLRKVEIMKTISHPNILSIKEVHENDQYVAIVTEFLGGGQLFQEISRKGIYTEADASDIVKQILSGINYLHTVIGVSHRDIKPENLLMTSETDFDLRRVVITGFGFAKLFAAGSMLRSACGSPKYVAPEVLKAGLMGGAYSPKCDVWSIGVLAYILLSGTFPFSGFGDELYDNILLGKYHFHDSIWVTGEAKDFITGLLTVDQDKRPSAELCLNHSWLHDNLRMSLDLAQLRACQSQLRAFSNMGGLNNTI